MVDQIDSYLFDGARSDGLGVHRDQYWIRSILEPKASHGRKAYRCVSPSSSSKLNLPLIICITYDMEYRGEAKSIKWMWSG